MDFFEKSDFVFGCLLSLVALYTCLGFFFKASWLHTDGRRKDGHWVVISCSRLERTAAVLAWAVLAATKFDSAFNKDSDLRDLIMLASMAVVGGLLYLINHLQKKKAQADSVEKTQTLGRSL